MGILRELNRLCSRGDLVTSWLLEGRQLFSKDRGVDHRAIHLAAILHFCSFFPNTTLSGLISSRGRCICYGGTCRATIEYRDETTLGLGYALSLLFVEGKIRSSYRNLYGCFRFMSFKPTREM